LRILSRFLGYIAWTASVHYNGLRRRGAISRHTVASTFEHEGNPVNNIDVFFLGRHEPQGVALHFETQTERAAMKEIRWWTISELERSSETVFPTDLAVVLRRLVESGVRHPIEESFYGTRPVSC
jgi:hypothetical protein